MNNLNKNIKIFFIDLDGTLLDAKDEKGFHSISEENLKAIEEISKTKEVIISTGRIGQTVEKFMKMTNVKYAVCGNGSIVIDNKGKVYKEDKLNIRQVIMLVDFAKKHKLSFKVDSELAAYGAINWKHRMLAKHFGFVSKDHYNLDVHQEYLKIVLWGKGKSKIAKLVGHLNNEIKELSVVTSSAGWTLEVTHEKSTKGLGNLKVASLLGETNTKKMLHIGDTMNDSTTIPYMRFVAMKNSSKKLKSLTDYIGPNYKNAGVAQILKGEYLDKKDLIKEKKVKVVVEESQATNELKVAKKKKAQAKPKKKPVKKVEKKDTKEA